MVVVQKVARGMSRKPLGAVRKRARVQAVHLQAGLQATRRPASTAMGQRLAGAARGSL